MHWHAIEAIATVFAAIGSIAVAIGAIWGDYFRFKWAGPKLALTLDNPRGHFFPRDGTATLFFHLKIKNRRLWSPARDVRVLVERAARPKADGTFVLEPLVYPLPLAWTPSELGDFLRTVFDTETCDLGFINKNTIGFMLSMIVTPSNFQPYVAPNEALRLQVVASGQNAVSKPLFLEIRWDGRWDADKDEMEKHLVVKSIDRL
jgi:hypothetical protein